jgi:serine/threonine-protein phosphatase 4 regulatory subunit 1
MNIISPTPPSRPFEPGAASSTYHAQSPATRRYGSGGSQESMGTGSASALEGSDAVVHAWDSVWPAADAPRRSSSEAGPSRLPTAPMSPYITPAFSQPGGQSPSAFRFPKSSGSPTFDPTQSPSAIPVQRRRRSVTQASPTGPTMNHPDSSTSPVVIRHSSHTHGHHRTSSNTTLPTAVPLSTVQTRARDRGKDKEREKDRELEREIDRDSYPEGDMPRSPGNDWRDSPFHSPAFLPTSPRAIPTRSRHNSSHSTSRGNINLASSPPTSSILRGGRPRALSMTGRISPHPPIQDVVIPVLPRPDSPHPSPSPQAEARWQDIPSLDDLTPSSSLPPISLPPAVSCAPPAADRLESEASPQQTATIPTASSQPTSSFAPLLRPGGLRRALSDYDARTRPPPPGLHRTLSITPELERSPKRTPSQADLRSPVPPAPGTDPDTSRAKKSPRRSPSALPTLTPITPPDVSDVQDEEDLLEVESIDDLPMSASAPQVDTPAVIANDPHVGLELLDEGDVLPSTEGLHMDVTFDDEGLNTLERIFLLSKSDYPFHRWVNERDRLTSGRMLRGFSGIY